MRDVLNTLANSQGMTYIQILEKTNLPFRTAAMGLSKLIKDGMVSVSECDRRVSYKITESGKRTLGV